MTAALIASGCGVGSDAAAALEAAAATVRARLGGDGCDLAVLFLGASYASQAEALGVQARDLLRPTHLAGMTVQGVVAGAVELEQPDALSLWAARLPAGGLSSWRYAPPRDGLQEPQGGWQPPPADTRHLIVLADPFSFPSDAFLAWLRQARPDTSVSGGLASGAARAGGNRLLLGEDVFDDGAVAIALGGEIRARTLVSQGCRPLGESWVVTRSDRNIVFELAGEPPAERLRATYAHAGAADQELMRRGLHIGTVVDEYADHYERGDFLIRSVLGAVRDTGALALGDVVRVGQTVRFQVRDAFSADEDLRELVGAFAAEQTPAGVLLFTCNGRGSNLFDTPDHDAATLRELLGDVAVAGGFCAGELGPVGSRSFLHGFTASLLAIDP